jgi:hypothetical protein
MRKMVSISGAVTEWDCHLYDGLAKEYHFFTYFLYYEILDLEPFFVLARATSGTQLNFPHGVLFIPSGTSYGLMNYVCDKIVDCRRMLLCGAQIYGS